MRTVLGNTQKKINLHHLSLSKVRLCGEGSSDKATTSRLEPLVFLAKYPETTNITCIAIPNIQKIFLIKHPDKQMSKLIGQHMSLTMS